MKKRNVVFALILCAPACFSVCRSQQPAARPESAAPSGDAAAALADPKAKVSYSIGMSIGSNLKGNAIEVDYPMLFKGIQDVMSGAKPLLTEQQVQQTLAAFQQEQTQKQQQLQKVQGEKNKTEGDAFLAANKAKEGVVTLPSGLQYEVVAMGAGVSPKESETVLVHYRGTLIGGKEFDSSYSRGEPATFSVNGVIPGMKEALLLMKPGAKWKLYVPSALAYGDRQAGPDIGPNAVLIFDVEMISINPPPPAGQPAAGQPKTN